MASSPKGLKNLYKYIIAVQQSCDAVTLRVIANELSSITSVHGFQNAIYTNPSIISTLPLHNKTKNLLSILRANKKIPYISSLSNELARLADKLEGKMRVSIVTAQDATQDEINGILSIVARHTGKQCSLLSVLVDKSLLQGVKIFLDDKYIDLSLRKKMLDIRNYVLNTVG